MLEYRKIQEIDSIVVHCSATDDPNQDNLRSVMDLHTSPTSKEIQWGDYLTHGRDWSHVGYHYYISKKGLLEPGISLDVVGSHCHGANYNSVGICLGGNSGFTLTQKLKLMKLIRHLHFVLRHGQDMLDVFPHNHFNNSKTCPNFDLREIGY